TGAVTQLTDKNALTVILATTGDTTLIAGGNLMVKGSVNGSLKATASGSISGSGNLATSGDSDFSAIFPGNISFTNLACLGQISANTTSGNATIINSGSILFSGSVVGVYSLKALTGGISDFGPVSATGGLVLEAPGQSRLDQDLSGPGGITFKGTGTLVITGTNTITGPTNVLGGTVILTGDLSSSPMTVSAGTFTGSGPVKSLTVTGGTANPDFSFSTSSLSVGKAGRLVFQVGGILAGVNQSVISASSVSISGKLAIAANPAFRTVMGSTITLVDNTGGSKVFGQFAGLPEGAQVLFNGMRYFISYRGGAGKNDVVLNRPSIVSASVANRLISVQDKDGPTRASFLPFGPFLGKVTISTGDINGDGVPDILAGSGIGNRPHVRVFNGVDLSNVASFYVLESSLMGEVSVAAGDINGDGRMDIIAAAGRGDPGLVRAYSGTDLTIIKSFFPFGAGYTGGVAIAAGDFNGDGIADIACGTGGLVPARVRVFDGATGAMLRNWTPFVGFSGSVSVAVGDFNGDGRVDLIAGAGAGGRPDVAIFNGATGRRIGNFTTFGGNYGGGVSVAAVDYFGTGRSEVLVTPLALKSLPVLRVYGFPGFRLIREFAALQQSGGASVAGANGQR
ncbi:MAG: VCBS repeat-containing protein, partial [Planctomycetes bacterium]|nr:VCBS repeat-containing protein [Planctomycetota bacterium]